MQLDTWLLYMAVASVNVLSPGPAILMAVTNSITYGSLHTFIASVGNACGLFIISTVSFLGVGALLQTSTVLFTIAKVVGACYLIYLGIKQLRQPARTIDSNSAETIDKQLSKTFRDGFLIALTNPKAVLFFTALFPLFIDASAPILPQFLIMTSSFILVSLIVLNSYGLTFRWLKRWFKTEGIMQKIQRLAGGLFIIFGLGLLRLSGNNR